jgi:glyoxylase-like metal-dependent hydrolase (beta-lactamase superfamily II)/rhodanese-related sulfurtransferase
MIFKQIVNDDLGCASYLVGDAHDKVLAVVDPGLDIAPYLRFAESLGGEIGHVVETHNHADHVSGHGALAEATGATIHVPAGAGAEFDHEPIGEGWRLSLGEVRLEAIQTPGHRPEHTSFAVIDSARSDEPWALLSGDSLFVGDVARPDLAIEREQGARDLLGSLGRLLELSDHTELWPGHLGGSLCGGASMDPKPGSTIGFERRHNDGLGDLSPDAFVDRLLAGLVARPPTVEAVVARNRGPLWIPPGAPSALAPSEVSAAIEEGAVVLDVRPAAEFAAAHVPGAVCAPLTASGFATRVARALGTEVPLLLVARDDAEAASAARRLDAVGLESLRGSLAGGFEAWRGGGRATDSLRLLEVDELDRTGRVAAIVDVRDPQEWRGGTIPGALNLPYDEIASLPELPFGLGPDEPIAVVCASGLRSALGASLLRRQGARRVMQVPGGTAAWSSSGRALAPGA